MDVLLKTGKYGAINKKDTITMGYYVIKIFSESYTLQEDTTCYVKVSTSGELVVRSQYMNCIQNNTKRYC